MSIQHPFIVVSMNRALSSQSETIHTEKEAIDRYWTLRAYEDTICVTIMEWCSLRGRYSSKKDIVDLI